MKKTNRTKTKTHFKGQPGVTTGHFGLLHAHILYFPYDFLCTYFVNRSVIVQLAMTICSAFEASQQLLMLKNVLSFYSNCLKSQNVLSKFI